MKENENIEEKKFTDVPVDENFLSEFPVPTYEEWKVTAEKALKGAPFEKMMVTKTYENIDLQPIYMKDIMENILHAKTLPGENPYVRNRNSLGYISHPWLISQECDQIMPEEFNSVLKVQLERGGTAINMIINGSVKKGQDINEFDVDLLSEGGLSVTTLQDLQTALMDIDLSKYPIYVFSGASSFNLLTMYAALCQSRGFSIADVNGCIGADPIGTLAQKSILEKDLEFYFDQMKDVLCWAKDNAKNIQTILVHGDPYHNAGASATQELAYAMATAVYYIKEMVQRGLHIDEVAPQIRFSFCTGTNFFMEIAKLRAARMIWSQIVESFGGNEESQKMIIHTRTSPYTKTVYDPYVNMLRTTSESFSAVVGGTDSMHVSYFDEPIRPSDEFSRRISRNTQIVLQEECNLIQPVDPAGGSWYIEELTKTVAEKTWEIFQNVETSGGILSSLKNKMIQDELEKVSEKRFANLATRKDVLVGINMYANMDEKLIEVPEVNYEKLLVQRMAQINEVINDIDEDACKKSLAHLESHKNCLNCSVKAVLHGATIGDISRAYGQDQQKEITIEPLKMHRLSERFENLRKATEDYKALHGKGINVFLANMGPIPQHKGRADFSTGFFEVGAFDVLKNDGFASVEEAAEAAVSSKAEVVIICSTDPTYPELVPPLAKLIKEKMPAVRLFLAGRPAKEHKQDYDNAGVDDYVFVGADVYKIITEIQKERGVI